MSDFMAKMHQIRFWLGLLPTPGSVENTQPRTRAQWRHCGVS